ncbi:MAG: hypothetical protein LBD07_00115 [Spirochaetaceae bacterium]|jgi:hypothetical protein|nr:hypothetical protein [Spirochaetaceae bacterium]
MSSYIPAKEADFVAWSDNLLTVAAARASEWNLVKSKIEELRALHDEVAALHQICQTPNYTKLDMQAKNEKKTLLKQEEEVFVRNNLQNNDAMTDNGRQALRIPIYDRTPTPRPTPDAVPDMETETPNPRTVRVKFRGINAPRWGKPDHVERFECVWLIADEPPARIEDLVHRSFATRNPLDLTFDEDQRGKRLHFACRWEGGAGKTGPWSEIFTAIIP